MADEPELYAYLITNPKGVDQFLMAPVSGSDGVFVYPLYAWSLETLEANRVHVEAHVLQTGEPVKVAMFKRRDLETIYPPGQAPAPPKAVLLPRARAKKARKKRGR